MMTGETRNGTGGDGAGRDREAGLFFAWVASTIFSWRKFILGVCIGVGVIAVAVTLMMPNRYTSVSRVLLPETGQGLSGMLMRNLPSSAAGLLGGRRKNDYIRYLAILHSRTLREEIVEQFSLIDVYDNASKRYPLESTIDELAKNTGFSLSPEFEYLAISVTDRDPQRAADMTNYIVRRLNEVNVQLKTQSAREYREFIEARYMEAEAAVDSVFNAYQSFQEQYGVIDLPAQAEGFYAQVAELRARALSAEIEYQTYLRQYGPENPATETARDVYAGSQRAYQRALAGQESLFPVPRDVLPQVGRRYAALELERAIQTTVIEVLRPMYEQAQLEERQQMSGLQILDTAIPPAKKSEPRRSIICIVAVLSAGILASLFALAMTWWRANGADIARTVHQGASYLPARTKENEPVA